MQVNVQVFMRVILLVNAPKLTQRLKLIRLLIIPTLHWIADIIDIFRYNPILTEYIRIYQNISEYIRIYQNISEYIRTYQIISEYLFLTPLDSP